MVIDIVIALERLLLQHIHVMSLSIELNNLFQSMGRNFAIYGTVRNFRINGSNLNDIPEERSCMHNTINLLNY